MTIMRAELRRIGSRRITRLAAVATALILVAVGVLTFANHSDTEPDMAAAEQLAAAQTASCMVWATDPASGMSAENSASECYSDPAWFLEDNRFHITDVLAYSGPGDAWTDIEERASQRGEIALVSLDGQLGEPTGKFAAAAGFTGGLVSGMFLVVLMATMLGATYIGADWRSGVLESQLVRVPSAVRLYAGKVAAIALAVSAATILIGGLYMLAVIPSAVWRGDFANGGTSFWIEVAGVIGRAAVLAAVMTGIGASLAMLARNTVAGVMLPLLALIGGSFLVNTGGRWTPFVTLGNNMQAIIGKADVPYIFIQRFANGGESWDRVVGHGPYAAAILLAVAAVGTLAASGGSFAYRDVS